MGRDYAASQAVRCWREQNGSRIGRPPTIDHYTNDTSRHEVA
jgi:hypothetical protein